MVYVLWTSVLVGLSALVCVYFTSFLEHASESERPNDKCQEAFQSYDLNNDGMIDFGEFSRLHQEKFVMTEKGVQTENKLYDFKVSRDEEMLKVNAYFSPLDMKSLLKSVSDVMKSSSLEGLVHWQEANHQYLEIPQRAFNLLYSAASMAVGKPWYIIKPKFPDSHYTVFPSTVHTPPKVTEEYWFLHNLLSMFHNDPFLQTRNDPRGTVAVVKAKNDEYLDLVLRCHAEFQLNAAPTFPLWFTPAYFSGRVIINYKKNTVQYLSLEVPGNLSRNVDMEWLTGADELVGMEVDIGYLPMARLVGTKTSSAVNEDQVFINDIKWNEEIPLTTATHLAQKYMYPFLQENYYPWKVALEKASSSAKLVHAVLLWGSLTDQAC